MDFDIRSHLTRVVATLRTEGPAHAGRTQLLNELAAYANRADFPSWVDPVPADRKPRRRTVRAGARRFRARGPGAPRWRDAAGRWCAVGHLMALSDRRLANRIARSFEAAWLSEMDEPALASWAAAHGFTLDELAWIQPAYFCSPVPECSEVELPPASVEAPAEPSCDGPDPALVEPFYPDDPDSVAALCETCGKEFVLWLDVVNRGSEEARGVTVSFWDQTPRYDEYDRAIRVDTSTVDIPAGGTRRVRLTAGSARDVGAAGWLSLTFDDDCDDADNEYWFGRGQGDEFGWVPPEACSTEDECLGAGGYEGCGCSNRIPASGWGGLVALTLLAARRRRS